VAGLERKDDSYQGFVSAMPLMLRINNGFSRCFGGAAAAEGEAILFDRAVRLKAVP
jgi:hypothetical protein